MRAMVLAVPAVLAFLATASTGAAQDDRIGAFLDRVAAVLEAGSTGQYARLFAASVPREEVEALAGESVEAGVTRAVVRERDRAPLAGVPAGEGYRLLAEVFTAFGPRGRIATYRYDIRRARTPAGDEGAEDEEWQLAGQERLTTVDGLYRLTLTREKQFAVSNLTLQAEDMQLTMRSGSAFVGEVEEGITALVLLGEGTLRFAPRPPAERGQVRILSGQEVLETPFVTAFVRLNPWNLETLVSPGALVARSVDGRDLARAQEVFDTEVVKSFNLDLSDLSRETWSLVPALGDVLAEIRTRRYRTLTYARSGSEPEDISLFDRARRRNISVYPSVRKLAARGPFYDEDDLADYDVVDYQIDASFTPDREWLEGRARFRLRIRAFRLTTLTFRLSESLVVRSVVSEGYGRLLSLRVKGQNSVLVSLPVTLAQDSVITLAVTYGGRLPPQQPDREAVWLGEGQAVSGQQSGADLPSMVPEARYIYSNRSWWYPQSTVTDYATATMRLTVPAPYDVAASGAPSPLNPIHGGGTAGQPPQKTFVFVAGQPVRYLSWLITKQVPVSTHTLTLAGRDSPPAGVGGRDSDDAGSRAGPVPRLSGGGVHYDTLDLSIVANPRQVARGRTMGAQVEEIMGYYMDLLGDVPYPTFTLALVDSDLPGGHSPAYFAVVYQPLPLAPFQWRNDPVSFDGYPQFFVAHELAHQFWGQAVGWKSYHEQWISEGFAQYFAALYAERFRGRTVFRDLLRQMRRSAIEQSGQGPIYLGYRLGHIQGDSRAFRAVLYNKSAMVLHMLRRLVGDDAFFAALRRFYHESRFRKAGTGDVRRAFEAGTGRSLERFFEQWVLGSSIPTLTFRYEVGRAPGLATTETASLAQAPGEEARLVFEQRGEPFDVPVTVTVTYASGAREDVVVIVSDARVEVSLPLRGPVRGIEANADHGALARIERPWPPRGEARTGSGPAPTPRATRGKLHRDRAPVI
jgi:hypothetical protein